MSFGCDWFQAGFSPVFSVLLEDFFLSRENLVAGHGNRFYSLSLSDGGMTLFYGLRAGCIGNRPYTVEIKGSWFRFGGCLDRLLQHWKSLGLEPDLQRFDARYDFSVLPEFHSPKPASRASVTEWHVDGKWSGWRVGKNERVWRFYDKAREQHSDVVWWRLECVLRGEFVKAIEVGNEFTMCFQCFELGRTALLWDQMPAFFRDMWSGVSSKVVSRDVVHSFEASFLHAKRSVISAVRAFARHFDRNSGGVFVDPRDVFEMLVGDAREEFCPPD